PQGRCRHRSHRVRTPHHLRLGRDHLPPRLENLLQARVPGRYYQNHDEVRVGAGELARMAAGSVLSPTQRAQDVRWIAAKPEKSVDEIGGKGRQGRQRAARRWTTGLPERLCRFVAKGDPVGHQSENGTSIVIPSFATTVSLNTSRASLTNSSA